MHIALLLPRHLLLHAFDDRLIVLVIVQYIIQVILLIFTTKFTHNLHQIFDYIEDRVPNKQQDVSLFPALLSNLHHEICQEPCQNFLLPHQHFS